MDKVKINLIVAIVIVAIVSIILAGYAANLVSQLNTEKATSVELNARVMDLQAKLSDANKRADNQLSLTNSLQSSLDAARREADNLKAMNAELDLKLKAAISKAAEPVPATQ